MAITALGLAACGGDDIGAPTTSAAEESSATSDTATSTGETGSTEDTDGTEDTGETAETGDPPEEVDTAELCDLACDAITACDIGVVDCPEACVEHHQRLAIDPAAFGAEVELSECVRALDCGDLVSYLEASDADFPCSLEAAGAAVPGQCLAPSFEATDATTCEIGLDCALEPARALSCSDGICTCSEAGVEVGSCAEPQSVCAGFSFNAINQCCGWSL